MSALSIQVPFPVFQDRDGQPLENGYIFLGVANLNPQTNPVIAYFDEALTIPAAQPLRTINGYISNAGTPAQVYVDGVNFSILVQDSKGSMVYNFPDATGISPDACGVIYDPPFAGGVAYPVCQKLEQTVSVVDFGAVGDGVTDDTVAIQNAELNVPVYAPPGTYLASGVANVIFLAGRQYGSGQIKTADGNKSAPNFSVISSPPTSVGNQGFISTAFNGDISGVQFPVGHVIKGATTLTQPTSGYYLSFETAAFYTQLYNSSGHNQSLSQPDGRTGTSAYMTKIFNDGQGDLGCYFGISFVTGTKAGSTNFLANPAAGIFGGQMNCGADGVYMNPYEVNLQDNGFDVACVGSVNNFTRTNNTGAKNVFWAGYLAQSIGSVAADSAFVPNGKWNNGLDLVNADFGTNKSAISLKEDQRIYFNNFATPTGGSGFAWVTNNYNNDYIKYGQGTDVGIQTYVNNVQSFTVRADAVTLNNINGLLVRNTGILRFEGTGQAITGGSTPSFSAANKPGSTNGQGPAIWLRIVVSGTEYCIPCWLP